jgi:hypothetical protein
MPTTKQPSKAPTTMFPTAVSPTKATSTGTGTGTGTAAQSGFVFAGCNGGTGSFSVTIPKKGEPGEVTHTHTASYTHMYLHKRS